MSFFTKVQQIMHNHRARRVHRESFHYTRVLIVLKQREVMYPCETEAEGQYSGGLLHSGLFNSASFIEDMLNESGHDAKLVHVVDNNGIDREVNKFRPDVVIIEAFWVVPEKFEVLQKLHPHVKWVIRNHSKTPFLANEGIAYDWALKYASYPNVYLSSNSPEANSEMQVLFRAMGKETDHCPYLPNFYPLDHVHGREALPRKKVVNIACFGAVRPLKNHMIQAIAAIRFAEGHGLKLRFHVNGNRVEGSGDNVLKNIRNLFKHLPDHELVEHAWVPHDKFLTICRDIDIGLQVSYTETYNIVAADLVSQGVPVITSPEVVWNDERFFADPNSSEDIAQHLYLVYNMIRQNHSRHVLKTTLERMEAYNNATINQWNIALRDLSRKG